MAEHAGDPSMSSSNEKEGQATDLTSGRITLAERAYREIHRRITSNELPAGAVFLEQDLTSLLGMSRTPVREAMIRLAKEGMVELRPRHGMRVLPLSEQDMREIYQILTALESEAAEEIARDGLPAQVLDAMRATITEMDRALDADDLTAWADADDKFHRLLIESCPNRRLRELVPQLMAQSRRARLLTLKLRPKPVSSNRDHLALVDAIERRDAEAARRIHREHRVRHGEMLVRLLQDYGLTHL